MKFIIFCLTVLLLSSSLSASKIEFPTKFVWGTATAAYQVEGAWNVSGKGPNIWDYFTSFPNLIYDNETGQVADDFYDRFQQDIQLMQNLSLKHFRLSFAWSRLLPTGDINYPNAAGVAFYNTLIDSLLAANITPYVTLYHWDLPQSFNDPVNGANSTWLNSSIIQSFVDYADFCFQTFGDRVKYWITFNEPDTFTWLGYGTGTHAPGRCSPTENSWCETVGGGGNTSTEPYLVAHNVLIAHGYAVQLYRQQYQPIQNGYIGINVVSGWSVPFDASDTDDINAVNTVAAFNFAWYYDPIFFGHYPEEMTSVITGGRLPTFTPEEAAVVNGSWDFIGLNHYTTAYVDYTGVPGNNWSNDTRVNQTFVNASGHQIGPQAASTWLYVYPQGLRGILNWVADRYGNAPIFIFENGVSCPNESVIPLPQVLNDTFRINFYKGYITEMVKAVLLDGVNVKGYFAWSLMDNFEWTDGYNVRFGLTYVDYDNNLTRYIKDSGYYYSLLTRTFAQDLELSEEYIERIPERIFGMVDETFEELEFFVDA